MSEPHIPTPPTAAQQLRSVMRVLRQHWKAITAIVSACLAISVGVTAAMPKIYQATNTLMVVAGGGDSLGNYMTAENLAIAKAESYIAIGSSPEVAALAAPKLDGARSEGVSFSAGAGTTQIRINGMSDTPGGAVKVANAYAEGLVEQVALIETIMRTGDAAQEPTENNLVQLLQVSSASEPTSPVSPSLKKNATYGLGVGILLSAVFVILRALLDRKVRSTESVEKATGASVLGTIPTDRRLSRSRQVISTTSSSRDKGGWATSEAIRELRTNLTFASVDDAARSVVITSSLPGEGKSLIAANLAAVMGAAGRPTILIDGDLRRPVQSSIFELPGDAGLTDLLSGAVELEDVLHLWKPGSNLFLLNAGRTPPNPSELLGSRRMKRLLEELTKNYFVIIDSPPILPVTDAAVLSSNADGAVIVAQANKTNLDALADAIGRLSKMNSQILGVVLNQVPLKSSSASQYGYYTKSYYYTDSDQKRRKKRARAATKKRSRRAK